MAICKHCGADVKDGATFCPVCGKVLIVKEKQAVCPICGAENSPEAAFCTICGAQMPGEKDLNLESESVQKLKELLPKIKGVSATFADPYSGADKAALTYVCPVCGKRNDLNAQRCVRCGRDRKRSAQLASKKRITSFKDAVEVPNKKYKPAPVEEPIEEILEIAPIEEAEVSVAPVEEYIAAEEVAEVIPAEEIVAEEAVAEEAVADTAPEAFAADAVEAPEDTSLEDLIAAAFADIPVEEPVAEEIPAEEELVAEEAVEEEVIEKKAEEPVKAEEKPAEEKKEQTPPPYPPYGYYYPPFGYAPGAPDFGCPPPPDAPQYGAYPQYAYPYGYGQLPPIIQPIAFVPYVSQDQPLWQVAAPEDVAAAMFDKAAPTAPADRK